MHKVESRLLEVCLYFSCVWLVPAAQGYRVTPRAPIELQCREQKVGPRCRSYRCESATFKESQGHSRRCVGALLFNTIFGILPGSVSDPLKVPIKYFHLWVYDVYRATSSFLGCRQSVHRKHGHVNKESVTFIKIPIMQKERAMAGSHHTFFTLRRLKLGSLLSSIKVNVASNICSNCSNVQNTLQRLQFLKTT